MIETWDCVSNGWKGKGKNVWIYKAGREGGRPCTKRKWYSDDKKPKDFVISSGGVQKRQTTNSLDRFAVWT